MTTHTELALFTPPAAGPVPTSTPPSKAPATHIAPKPLPGGSFTPPQGQGVSTTTSSSTTMAAAPIAQSHPVSTSVLLSGVVIVALIVLISALYLRRRGA